jgi:uncharacterized protein (TIGR03067 family)
MIKRVLPALLFALSLAGCTSTPTGPSLVGHWGPVTAELGGKDFPVANFDGGTLMLTADRYDFAGDNGTYELLPGGPPKQMDIHGQIGPNAGRNIPVIYLLEGDQLTVCYQLASGERPKEFVSPQGSKILLVRYKRLP